jgi:outer membrane phospholipase A
MTGGNDKKAREMDSQIHHEEMYMQEKPNMDIARGKFVINPYLTNCFYLDRIDDPSPDLLPRKKRFAIKWQVSVQMPVITAKYSNTGLFCAFTNRALFDITNDLDSRPVTYKTFMPEVLGRLDFSQFQRRLGTDQLVLQAGAQHESNGGVDDTLSLMDSRGIRARLYIQPIARFMRIIPDSTGRYLCSDKYHLMVNARLFYPYGTWDNKNIETYIGYFDLNASYEFAPVVPFFGRRVPLGVFKVEGSLSPGGSVSPIYTSFSIDVSYTPPMISNRRVYYGCLPKVPLTPYFRFFSGYNEFLNTYDKRTTVVAFGIRLRS